MSVPHFAQRHRPHHRQNITYTTIKLFLLEILSIWHEPPRTFGVVMKSGRLQKCATMAQIDMNLSSRSSILIRWMRKGVQQKSKRRRDEIFFGVGLMQDDFLLICLGDVNGGGALWFI